MPMKNWIPNLPYIIDQYFVMISWWYLTKLFIVCRAGDKWKTTFFHRLDWTKLNYCSREQNRVAALQQATWACSVAWCDWFRHCATFVKISPRTYSSDYIRKVAISISIQVIKFFTITSSVYWFKFILMKFLKLCFF